MRQVDHVHDAEDESQAGGQQEQHQPELQPVQQLLGDQGERQEGLPFIAGSAPLQWRFLPNEVGEVSAKRAEGSCISCKSP